VADGVTLRPSPEDAATRLFADLDPKTRAWALERYTPHPIAFRFRPVKLTQVQYRYLLSKSSYQVDCCK